MDDELEGAGELGFDGGDIDFAVALAGVAVAGFEEGSFDVDGDEEGGAFDQFLIVHVAGVGSGRSGVEFAGGFGWRDAHAAEEWMQGNGDAGGEGGGHLFEVEGDGLGEAVGEVFGEETVFAGSVASPGDVDVDFLNADFKDVAGFGLGDGDGAGEDVAAGASVGGGDFVVDGADVVGDIGGGDAGGLEAGGWAAGGEGLDGDGVAGVDVEDWFGLGPVISPGYGCGGGEEGVGLLGDGEGREEGGGTERG